MDPRTDSLFAGIAGLDSDLESFELGHGVTLKRTYAHFMAPFMMAFSPAEEGKPHPAPWSAVKGGLFFDIHVELHVPNSFSVPDFFDRLNVIWWTTALLRLKGATTAHAPVVTNRPLSEVPKNWQGAAILPKEKQPRSLFFKPNTARLTEGDLEWLKKIWLKGGKLIYRSSDFNDAFQAMDAAGSFPNSAVALLTVWGALEHLFSPAKQELHFRVSANIASFLEPIGQARLELHRRLLKLNDARSGVAHGAK